MPRTVNGTGHTGPSTVNGTGQRCELIAARRRLAEIYDREDHECDVEAGVPVAVAAIVNAPVAAEEEGLRGRRLGGGPPRRWRASDAVDAPLQL